MMFRFNRWVGWIGAALLAAHADGQVLITEFMAANTRTIADEDGDFPDWIELYNSSAEPVNLEGWFLTDSQADLTRWRFPSVLLAPNRYLVVFASGKNRKEAGGQLHTNFKLASGGQYLALVKRNGVTVACEYAPQFPAQVADVSFGMPVQQTVTKLLAVGAPSRVLVPASFGAPNWTDLDFGDSLWPSASTGVGFDMDDPLMPEVIGGSVADFSGTQGQRGWFYGYYNKTTDRVAGYHTTNFVAFPNDEGPHGFDNFWNGVSWVWFNGNPPRDEITPDFARPNGTNSSDEHWLIRRWRCTFTGTLTVDWTLAKKEVGGNGVTGRVFHNGAQLDLATIGGDDLVGTNRTLVITNARAGDLIDFALSPVGITSASDDTMDASIMTATIRAFATLTNEVNTDIAATMRGVNATVYARFPFVVTNRAEFEFLTLRMKYDAGFVAYLNGVEVARANAPDEPQWNSTATAERLDTDGVQFEEFNLSPKLDLLRAGENILAIQGLNSSVSDGDFLLLPELAATGVKLDAEARRYFSTPTPGALNGVGNTNLGPLIVEVTHTPAIPQDSEDLIVTARVMTTFEAVQTVTLTYRVMYGTEVSVPMLDDGLQGDGAAGDGMYSGTIPASASTPGQMVRYFITARDTSGDASRRPLYQNPTRSAQYLGTVVADPSVVSPLPLFHWFLQNASAADSGSGTRGSLFFNGEFYDNITANLHGQSSAGFRKKSYDFDLNPGDHLRWADGQPRVDDFNLLTTYPDKALMRNMLAYETHRDAGSPYHFAFPVRVQRNGAFFSVAHFVENGDDNYLERLGLDQRGALYKMYNTLDTATGEKKTRKDENFSDLSALIAGSRLTGTARNAYLFDNINIPEVINYLAAMILTGNVDCCHKNYYLYRDTEGTGEWQMLPWDVDLSFGRVWNSGQTYWDELLHPDTGVFVGNNNTLPIALFNTPAIRQMYLRRLRTLMDELLQPRNTPPLELKFERRINEYAAILGPDAALDLAKWQTFGRGAEVSTCCVQTLPQAVAILTTNYLPARRLFLYNTQTGNNGARIATAQPTNAIVNFGAIDFNPASGNQAQEYIELINPNTYAVDISGWQLAGDVVHTFQAGVVLPATNKLYVSPDLVSFRRRTVGPRGGQGLFVQGNYQGQLSARGGNVTLFDNLGRRVSALAYPGSPTLAQQYLRVTEVMYHPGSPPPGSPFVDEDFEFIEVSNTGPTALDLTGVRFTDGIDFSFADGAVRILGSGRTVVVVKNLAAFKLRYGESMPIAGTFQGSLDNAGEKIRLSDGVGETVLEFTYSDNWYPATDGFGYSLVVADETLPWTAWNAQSAWGASRALLGSPGRDEAEQAAWQTKYFSLAEQADPAVSGDAADPDADAMSNFQEYLSGTHPRDRQSYLKITEVTHAGDHPLIRFMAAEGKTYTIQYRDSITDGQWVTLTDVPAQTTTRLMEVADPDATGKTTRYYRLVTPQGP